MTPRSLVPSPTAVPFDDLELGRKYRWTLRVWNVPQALNMHYTVDAQFVQLSSLGRGEQLRCDVIYLDNTGGTFYRAQILNIEAL